MSCLDRVGGWKRARREVFNDPRTMVLSAVGILLFGVGIALRNGALGISLIILGVGLLLLGLFPNDQPESLSRIR